MKLIPDVASSKVPPKTRLFQAPCGVGTRGGRTHLAGVTREDALVSKSLHVLGAVKTMVYCASSPLTLLVCPMCLFHPLRGTYRIYMSGFEMQNRGQGTDHFGLSIWATL